MEIKCRYLTNNKIYYCNVIEERLTQKELVIKKFIGRHGEGKGDKDVQGIWFTQLEVDLIPRGFQEFFPNLIHLDISNCGLKEISKYDLKGFERIVRFQVSDCDLTTLPDDLFTEMPNLRTVIFEGNKIEYASSKLLKPLLGRENVRVGFLRNKINAQFWPGHRHGSLGSLEELMKLIDEKCLKPPPIAKTTEEMWVSDITIITDDMEFKVHKNILGMRSSEFDQIFQTKETELKIPDFSSDAVEALIQFIYTNETSDDWNAKENFEIADKFKVKDMKSINEEIIGDQINEANAWELFLFAHKFSSELLKVKSFQQILKIFPEQVPNEFMDDPEKLKKLIDARKAYEEMLAE